MYPNTYGYLIKNKHLHSHLVQLLLHGHQKIRQTVTDGNRLSWIRGHSFGLGSCSERLVATLQLSDGSRSLKATEPIGTYHLQKFTSLH